MKAITDPNKATNTHQYIQKIQKYLINILSIKDNFHFCFFSASSVVTGNKNQNNGPKNKE